MSCYHPIPALILRKVNPETGKMDIKLLPRRENYRAYCNQYGKHNVLMLPCGHCLGCSKDRAREWSSRLALESKYHDQKCFLTLTYDDVHLPKRLRKKHLQDFFKRLRKDIYPIKVRYFACGEYGEHTKRPHYHVILFGFNFADDRVEWSRGSNFDALYISNRLSRLWTFGLHSIGDVSEESCAYVARYSQKKLLGLSEFGDEFVLMSTRPAIGIKYLEDHPEIWDVDKITDGVLGTRKRCSIPRIFEKKYPFDDDRLAKVKEHRVYMNNVLTAHALHRSGNRYLEEYLIKTEKNKAYVPRFRLRGV